MQKDRFSGLSARRIAADIGYAAGTIYNVFGSIDDLYLSVNGLILDELYKVPSSPKCQPLKKTPTQNIKKMAELYREFTKEYREHWLMLFTYIPRNDKPQPSWYQDKITKLFEPLEELLQPFYTDKQSKKRKVAVRSLWASVHDINFLEETGKIPRVTTQEASPSLTDCLIDNFILGLKCCDDQLNPPRYLD